MIGPQYRQKAAQAVFGSARSQLIPAVLWLGWLNGDGVELTTSRVRVDNTDAVFGPSREGVTNVSPIDAGTVTGTVAALGLWDAPTGGAMVISANLLTPVISSEDEPLVIGVAGLVFEVTL